jgi:hypothetical protein
MTAASLQLQAAHNNWPDNNCMQNAGKRPNTYKLLLQDIVRQKAAQHQIPIPDQATLQMMAERSVAGLKVIPAVCGRAVVQSQPGSSQLLLLQIGC